MKRLKSCLKYALNGAVATSILVVFFDYVTQKKYDTAFFMAMSILFYGLLLISELVENTKNKLHYQIESASEKLILFYNIENKKLREKISKYEPSAK